MANTADAIAFLLVKVQASCIKPTVAERTEHPHEVFFLRHTILSTQKHNKKTPICSFASGLSTSGAT